MIRLAIMGRLCVGVVALMVVGASMYALGEESGWSTTALPPSVGACRESFKDLPALAARLGVPRHIGDTEGSVFIRMCNGDDYDFFALVNAALDRLDAPTHR